MAHGFGMMTWDDGSYYQGTLKKNLKHGHGSFVFFKDRRIHEDTNIYKAHFGEWKNGLKHNHVHTVVFILILYVHLFFFYRIL